LIVCSIGRTILAAAKADRDSRVVAANVSMESLNFRG